MARRSIPAVDRLATLRAHLATALLSGADTTAIRRDLAAIDAEESARAATDAAEAARRAQAEAARLAGAADALAQEAAGRIAATMAALEPPPAPWGRTL